MIYYYTSKKKGTVQRSIILINLMTFFVRFRILSDFPRRWCRKPVFGEVSEGFLMVIYISPTKRFERDLINPTAYLLSNEWSTLNADGLHSNP